MTSQEITPETTAGKELLNTLKAHIESTHHITLDHNNQEKRTTKPEKSADTNRETPPRQTTSYSPAETLGAPLSDFIAMTDAFVSHDILTPERAKVYTTATLAGEGYAPNTGTAKDIFDKAPGTIDATLAVARNGLRTTLPAYIATLDNLHYPLKLNTTWRLGNELHDGRANYCVHHPGKYHFFKHMRPADRPASTTHAYTVAVEEYVTRDQSQHGMVDNISIHRFDSKADLKDWLYPEEAFQDLDEAQYWKDIVDDLGLAPEVAPLEQLTPKALADYSIAQPDLTDHWTELQNYDPELVEEARKSDWRQNLS
ncbi:hypothetical protein [Salinibaculum rarum]|uniref:hypothetical protein n=1 Tax=Salinibaculum rarum TaxID=3058903 RepID=UPI00265F47D7|nr:hypothetical protein [Salinibaculum sp. KK48]